MSLGVLAYFMRTVLGNVSDTEVVIRILLDDTTRQAAIVSN